LKLQEKIMSALRKVLVVDDDAVVGKSFNRVLSKKGYVVTSVQNAHEALKQVREQSFDVVFTDIKMPGMDGVELAEQLKARQPWTPVVIITGYGSTENETRARAAGVSDFMRKPLSPEMIEESAAHAMLAPVAPMAARLEVVKASDVHVEVPAPAAAHPARTVALLLAAPFIGLAYAVVMPLVGLVALLWMGGKALLQTQAAKSAPTFLKNVALLVAAPFIGLVYAMALPFVGMGFLLVTAAKALASSRHAPTIAKYLGYAAKLVAAPFVGLAFAVMLPLIGTAMLFWVGGKALMTRAEVA
jgi:CheY-like chemotaxis protein